MSAPPWYSWPEFDPEKGVLRSDAPPEVIAAYERERIRFEREQREAWGQMEKPLFTLDDDLLIEDDPLVDDVLSHKAEVGYLILRCNAQELNERRSPKRLSD
jgi:hypothetical protein